MCIHWYLLTNIVGLVKECELAIMKHLLELQILDEIKTCLSNYQLPLDFKNVDINKVMFYLQSDKKNVHGKIGFVFVNKIG